MIETVAEFIRLVESDDPKERARSTSEDAPLAIWNAIVARNPEMRFWVAHNRTIPNEVLRVLARDSDWRVRHRVAGRKACPEDILELLSDDQHDSVVSAVAGHPNTPTAALHRLVQHPWDQVRAKAIRQLLQRGEEVAVSDGSTNDGDSHE